MEQKENLWAEQAVEMISKNQIWNSNSKDDEGRTNDYVVDIYDVVV